MASSTDEDWAFKGILSQLHGAYAQDIEEMVVNNIDSEHQDETLHPLNLNLAIKKNRLKINEFLEQIYEDVFNNYDKWQLYTHGLRMAEHDHEWTSMGLACLRLKPGGVDGEAFKYAKSCEEKYIEHFDQVIGYIVAMLDMARISAQDEKTKKCRYFQHLLVEEHL